MNIYIYIHCLEKLPTSLQNVLSEMAAGSVVPPELLANTETQMAGLMNGIRQIAIAVQQSQQRPKPMNTETPKRESSEPIPVTSVRKRLIGKQSDLSSVSLPVPGEVPALPGTS